MIKKLVSIILPVYNVEDYLRDCLDSLLMPSNCSLEIIAVNDGSTDSSPDILQEYADKDSRVKVLHKTNGGLASARNHGLPHVSGDYVLFVDSDDIIAPHAIDNLIQVAQENQADIVSFGFKKFYKNTDITDLKNVSEFNARTIDAAELFRICFDENYKTKYSSGAYAWARLFKKSVLDGLTFDDNRRLYEDEDFTAKLLSSLNESHKIVLLDIPVYYYRQRNSSLVHSKRSKRLFALYACRSAMLKRFSKTSTEYGILNKARLTTLIKIMQISLAEDYYGGYKLFQKILCSRKDLSLKTKLPYLLGRSVAKSYSIQRLDKAKQKNLKLQYWN